jgi:large subunit ribosomal protein L2
MSLKHYKPTNSSQRGLILIDRSELWKGAPVKSLTEGLRKTGGRNSNGRITTRHIGGGHKQRYRFVDFKRTKHGVPAVVERLEYDPNRTAFIALIKYTDGEQAYILAPQRLGVGDQVVSAEKADIKPGNAVPLKNIPIGTIVHNVEMKPGKGGQLARSAGTYIQIVGRDGPSASLKLASGEVRKVSGDCMATIGALSNPDQKNINLAKGVAMNPVDHPMGGGEGRTSGGRHPCTPWGKPTKGKKTRNRKKASTSQIIRRRK